MGNKCYSCRGVVENCIDGRICSKCGHVQNDDLKKMMKNRINRLARLRKLNTHSKPKENK